MWYGWKTAAKLRAGSPKRNIYSVYFCISMVENKPKEDLAKTPQGRLRLDTSKHLCTKRVVRPWSRVLERESVLVAKTGIAQVAFGQYP